jgi:phage baseplate assembly protein W
MSGSKNCGWKFPVMVDKRTGRIRMSNGEEDIHESVRLIVHTAKNERIMRPEFGSNINRYAFEPGSISTMIQIEKDLKTAIENWEPRVADVEVKAHSDDNQQEKIMIDISYRVISLDVEFTKTIELKL